jgi:hypothetical protein
MLIDAGEDSRLFFTFFVYLINQCIEQSILTLQEPAASTNFFIFSEFREQPETIHVVETFQMSFNSVYSFFSSLLVLVHVDFK